MFERIQPIHRILAAITAHLDRRLKACAKGWAFGFSENQAPVIVAELDAAYASGFAVGHAGYRGGNGGRGTAGAAMIAAIHGMGIESRTVANKAAKGPTMQKNAIVPGVRKDGVV